MLVAMSAPLAVLLRYCCVHMLGAGCRSMILLGTEYLCTLLFSAHLKAFVTSFEGCSHVIAELGFAGVLGQPGWCAVSHVGCSWMQIGLIWFAFHLTTSAVYAVRCM
jgi:hypothetical protein